MKTTVFARLGVVVRVYDSEIATIEDRRTGLTHSPHPSISSSGSVDGMRKKGYWGAEERTLRGGNFIYNIDGAQRYTSLLDVMAAQLCQCGATHRAPHFEAAYYSNNLLQDGTQLLPLVHVLDGDDPDFIIWGGRIFNQTEFVRELRQEREFFPEESSDVMTRMITAILASVYLMGRTGKINAPYLPLDHWKKNVPLEFWQNNTARALAIIKDAGFR